MKRRGIEDMDLVMVDPWLVLLYVYVLHELPVSVCV